MKRTRSLSLLSAITSRTAFMMFLSLIGVTSVIPADAQNTVTQESSANRKKVTGRIVDNLGEPITGATVRERGTQNGALTDVDGNYTIYVANENADLEVSYVGYQTIIVKANRASRIRMQEFTGALNEIVVVGYGTSSSRKLVSSVSTVKTDKIADLAYTSTSESLQGRVSGLIVQNSGGEPGNPPKIYIRGGGTPLYVIDGIIRTAEDFNALTSSDIENVSILKDASATAVYGAQAGNGIVLVTTKKGGTEVPLINYTAGFTWTAPTVIPERANTKDYTDAYNRAYLYDGYPSIFYTPEEVSKMADVDWYKLCCRSWAPEAHHNLNMSGKTKSGLSYYASANILDQSSIFKSPYDFNDTFKRYSVRTSLTQSFEKIGLDVGMSFDGSLEKRNPNVRGGGWYDMLTTVKPYQRAFNDDGTYTDLDLHPLAWLDKDEGYDHQRTVLENIQLNATWNLPWVKGLKANVIGNYNYSTFDEKKFYSVTQQYSASGAPRTPDLAPNRYLDTNHWWQDVKDIQVSLDYQKQISRHFFELQGVYTFSKSHQESTSNERRNYVSKDLDQVDFGGTENQKAGGMTYESARMGWVGRLRYNYADKYFFEGNFRYDGSDNFAPGHRWGFFPSGAIAWAISEEHFMKPLKDKHIVDFLKLRASYGKVGLEEGVARFGYKSLFYYSSYGLVVGNGYQPTVREGNLVDPANLSWYTQKSFDIGLDWYTLKNALSITLDYFYYKTTDYLMAPKDKYVTTLGKDLPQVKSDSELRRQGIEAAIKYHNEWKDLKYELGLNFTSYDEMWALNENEDLDQLMNPRKRTSQHSLNWGDAYRSTGIYTTMDQILDSPHFSNATELRPGDLGYVDVNGDGKIDTEDQVRFGKPVKPTFDYGFNFNLNYKGFFLYGLFQGTGSRYVQLGGQLRNSNFGKGFTLERFLNFWTPDNTGGEFPTASTFDARNAGNNTVVSDFWMVNARYFRLKSLQFGYDFKYSLMKNWNFLTQFKLSLAGTNLLTISDAMDYFDPEAADAYLNAYPVQKTLSVVLNIGF
ncbi:SusC/RagA family TonB-linked outer membrane protein [Hallella multisaccharivorax]|uniref:SusC/RagA family TonB-linked outer membrane protein n=1 Tax=Hallella multisaccharivorax TaxID=310514 RepID=UPI003614A47B